MMTFSLVKVGIYYGIRRNLFGFIPFGFADMRHRGFFWGKCSRHFMDCWSTDQESVEQHLAFLKV